MLSMVIAGDDRISGLLSKRFNRNGISCSSVSGKDIFSVPADIVVMRVTPFSAKDLPETVKRYRRISNAFFIIYSEYRSAALEKIVKDISGSVFLLMPIDFDTVMKIIVKTEKIKRLPM